MNSIYGSYDKSLQDIYLRAKSSKHPKEMFKFLRKYILYVENDSKSAKHIFILRNPLVNNDSQRSFLKEFNNTCLDFLVKIALSQKNKKLASEAQAYLGLAYETGLFGLNINTKNAFNYYTVSAKQNNKLGTYRLAQCFEKGIGKITSYSNAIYFYRCSAKLGCIFGMHTYGSILIRGELRTAKNFNVGLFYLKLAVQQSDSDYPYSFYDLAQLYESKNSIEDMDPDDEYAFILYERGANLGCPNCQYRLAKCYETGDLFQQPNIQKSIEFYNKAAENGQIDAQYMFSKYLFTGVDKVLQKDFSKAYLFALRAATRGHPEASFTVAEFIENGCGTKKNLLGALWWYTISADFGNKQAIQKRKNLRYKVNMKNDGPTKLNLLWCCF